MVAWGEGARAAQLGKHLSPCPPAPHLQAKSPPHLTGTGHRGYAPVNTERILGTPDQITGSSPSFKDI